MYDGHSAIGFGVKYPSRIGGQTVIYCMGLGVITSNSGIDAISGKGLDNDNDTTDWVYFQYTRSGTTYYVGHAIVF